MTQASFTNSSELTNGNENLALLLDSALLLSRDYLKQFAQSSAFFVQMELIFGVNIDNYVLEILRQQWLSSQVVFPTIVLVSLDELNGAYGAFAQANQTIYLAQEYLWDNANNPQLIVEILLEEYGHFVDAQINDIDAQGDEGEIFSALVRGELLSPEDLQALQAEDDTAIITVDGTSLQVEQANGDYSLSFDVVSGVDNSSLSVRLAFSSIQCFSIR